MRVEGIGYIRRGAARCPKGIVCDTAITTSVPRSLRHDASHLGFGGPQSRFLSYDVPPPPRQERLGLDFGCELLVTLISDSCGTNMDHKKSAEVMANTIKRSTICGRCHATETASHIFCECATLAGSRFHR
jgi:hypothetical protein